SSRSQWGRVTRMSPPSRRGATFLSLPGSLQGGYLREVRNSIYRVALASVLLLGCSPGTPSSSSETHFLACTIDADCKQLGAGYSCQEGLCQPPIEAGVPEAGQRLDASGRDVTETGSEGNPTETGSEGNPGDATDASVDSPAEQVDTGGFA